MMATKREVFMNTDNQETKVALLELSINHINETLIRFEKKFDNMFDKVEQRFDKIDKQFDRLENRIWMHFYILGGAILSVLGIVAKIKGWF